MRIDEVSRVAEHGIAAERRLSGLGVSPGIAIGRAYIAEGGDLPVRESHLPETAIDAERGRFAEAVTVSQRQLRKLKTKAAGLPGSAAEEVGYLLDAYLAVRIEDIRVVGKRLIRNLIKKPYATYSAMAEGAIILADELTPADTALMDPQRVAGFATMFGGAESHTAIVARALGLPAVLAVPSLLGHARADDGVEITLEGNLELPVELPQALAQGAMGLGLVRSEFLYMNRDDLPSEDEQYAIFSALVRGMGGRPVTVRTF